MGMLESEALQDLFGDKPKVIEQEASLFKEMLNKRISPTSPEVGKTSLLIWFRTLESTLKLDCKRIWLPGWILTDKETGTEYTIEGIGGSIAPFR